MKLTPEELQKKQEELVAELRKTAESGKAESAESKLKIEKLEKALNLLEEENQKVALKMQDDRKLAEEQKARLDDFETKASRMGRGEKEEENPEQKKAFSEFILAAGTKDMTPEHVKYLRTDRLADGAALVPDRLFEQVQKQIIEISSIKRISRVITANVKTLSIPVRTTIPSTNRPGEGGTSTKSNSQYVLHNLTAHRNDTVIPVTRDMLKFAFFNMENEMRNDAALSLAQQEGADFVNGDAIEKSEGFMTNSDIASINSGIADDIQPDNLIDLTGELKTGYDPVYTMNRKTIAAIRKMKGGIGQYLWVAGLSAGLPNTINGFPYVEVPDMPDIGAATFPVAFGDFRRGYFILQENTMEVVIDIYTQKLLGIIEYLWREYVGGKVVLAEAIKKLKCSV